MTAAQSRDDVSPGGPEDAPAPPDARRRGDLVLVDVAKSYGGVEALKGVDLTAHAGEVHALIGENGAGKSTLVKILSGAVRADRGSIFVDGEACALGTTSLARAAGIATAYQELSMLPDWDVATNLLYLEDSVVRAGRFSPRASRRLARRILADYGIRTIDPGRMVRELRLAERQMLEIVRALRADPRVLILDEPTSALTPEQVNWAFERVREFVARDRLVLFISHRMEEIVALCDRVTVLRDGRHVGSDEISAMPESRLVQLMLGAERERMLHEQHRRRADTSDGTVSLEVERFGSAPGLREVSFQIGKGEILGVAGLEGQGQSQLFMALYGARRATGSVSLDGRRLRLRSPAAAMRQGVGLVPEDRGMALCLPLTIRANLTLGTFNSVTRMGIVSSRREAALASRVMARLKVRAQSGDQIVETLSGGNQQKVLLGRVLESQPRLLLMYDATRGVDIATKADIFGLMQEQAANGVAILFYSTDTSELVNACDRVIVMHDGRIRATLGGSDLSRERIISASLGGVDV